LGNQASTNITRKGLLTLCHLELTHLGVGTGRHDAGYNNYGDEGAFIMGRHFPGIQYLFVQENGLTREGTTAIANNLTKLEHI